MVSDDTGSAIGVQEGFTNDVINVLWNKIIVKVETKKCQNTAVQIST